MALLYYQSHIQLVGLGMRLYTFDWLLSLIDIRDTVNYKEVMKQYNLGPNGGIVTSLNLFATRFDQVMNFIDKRSQECKYVSSFLQNT